MKKRALLPLLAALMLLISPSRAQISGWGYVEAFPWVYLPDENSWAYILVQDNFYWATVINTGNFVFIGEASVSTSDDDGESPENADTLRALGWYLASQFASYEFTEAEYQTIAAGVTDALAGEPEPAITVTEVNDFLEARGEEQNAAFIANLRNDPEVTETQSGLFFRSVVEGTGDSPSASDRVEVNYRGTLIDGTVFDSSFERNEPTEFDVNGVITGFAEGLQLMKVGGEAVLYIPADLGYGDNPPSGSGIPAGAILVFEVELLQIVQGNSSAP